MMRLQWEQGGLLLDSQVDMVVSWRYWIRIIRFRYGRLRGLGQVRSGFLLTLSYFADVDCEYYRSLYGRGDFEGQSSAGGTHYRIEKAKC